MALSFIGRRQMVAIAVGVILVVAFCVPPAAAACDNGAANSVYSPLGEECDNGNSRGCSSNCLVDSMFYCWGTPSTCVKSYPLSTTGSGKMTLQGTTFPDSTALSTLQSQIATGASGNGASVLPAFVTLGTPVLVGSNYEVPFSISYSALNAGTVPIATQNLRNAALSGSITRVNSVPVYTFTCGNQIVEMGEACDGLSQDGCTNCSPNTGYNCRANLVSQQNSSGSFPFWTCTLCGNSVVNGGSSTFNGGASTEQCDDGNVSGSPIDGCSRSCMVENGWNCGTNGVGLSSCTQGTVVVACGNGVVQAGEVCDDGNVVSGDGCSSNCLAVESGFTCTLVNGRSVCSTGSFTCGNAVVQAGEVCDDGNVVSGDGCAFNCLSVESGYSCSLVGSRTVCSFIGVGICGNGLINTGESCDDGNAVSGDGCSNQCAIESGFNCVLDATGRSICSIGSVCGNSVVNAGESCDDGNRIAGDGCSTGCTIESGFSCIFNSTLGRSFCSLIGIGGVCGNGVVNTGETCDDGNGISGDGCSNLCVAEAGFNCVFNSALGRSVCSLFNTGTGTRFDADDDDSDELWWVILLCILAALCLLLLLYLCCKKRRREPEPIPVYEPKPAPLFVHPPPAIAPAVMYEVYDTY